MDSKATSEQQAADAAEEQGRGYGDSLSQGRESGDAWARAATGHAPDAVGRPAESPTESWDAGGWAAEGWDAEERAAEDRAAEEWAAEGRAGAAFDVPAGGTGEADVPDGATAGERGAGLLAEPVSAGPGAGAAGAEAAAETIGSASEAPSASAPASEAPSVSEAAPMAEGALVPAVKAVTPAAASGLRVRAVWHGDGIPMDMLFREDDTTEQPRVLDPDATGSGSAPGATTAAMEGIAAATALADTAARADGSDPMTRTNAPSRTRHRALDALTARQTLAVDSELTERPGRVLSGWLALFVGLLASGGCAALVWWTGVAPVRTMRALHLPVRERLGFDSRYAEAGLWAALAVGAVLVVLAFGGLSRGRVGNAWVLTLCGRYQGSVRRTGLVWMSPAQLRRRLDVRLRHWHSDPMPAVDANGVALVVVVVVVWRVRDTARAMLGVEDHEEYLSEQVEAALARVLSQLPTDAFHADAPTLRDAEAVGDSMTRVLAAECEPVGIQVFSAQPTRIEYAPEVAAAMRRSQISAIDAKQRDGVLSSVVDAVHDTVARLTERGLVELDDYERKALVKDLTVAFYTSRESAVDKS
ncbi:SPFH domain-containing protein [Streptomyces sp. H27-D2]|uniref:SPFH domain-containing protein n=1 Tax=Streptomyces sp. H27-D2 TaxID=3046304 RepID=UPI002DBE5DFA|nr:SPFH domain-containing protein [Streptomyces sp. H27-D2]MEC4015186.1 SPFH domain-containing protein [Streptomyces sp. H27-D2]